MTLRDQLGLDGLPRFEKGFLDETNPNGTAFAVGFAKVCILGSIFDFDENTRDVCDDWSSYSGPREPYTLDIPALTEEKVEELKRDWIEKHNDAH